MRVGSTALAEAADPRLERLLDDLGAQGHRGGLPELGAQRCATGLPELDRRLGGGVPTGGISELTGPASSGRTSLALALLAQTTRSGHYAAWVDQADAFDPISAEAAGADLPRVLWARPTGTSEALRSLEQILTAQGFALVVWDLDATASRSPSTSSSKRPTIPTSAWPRLRKVAASAQAALVLLAGERTAGTFADLAIALSPARARFDGGTSSTTSSPSPSPSSWLDGLESELTVARNRLGPLADALPLSWQSHPALTPPAPPHPGRPASETPRPAALDPPRRARG